MSERNAKGQFIGTSREDVATQVRSSLSVDQPRTATELVSLTGLTRYQVIHGISYLRRVIGKDCIITWRGKYSLAENALDVRDYAEHLAKTWLSQIETMHQQMELAEQILANGDATTVRAAVKILNATGQVVQQMLVHK